MELIVRLIVIHCLLIWIIFVVYATDDCSRFNETSKKNEMSCSEKVLSEVLSLGNNKQ